MKATRTVFAFLLVLIGTVAAQSAFAAGPYRGGYYGGYRGGHGGSHWHGSVGLYFGFPAFGYPYYAPYYYPAYYPPYYASPVIVQQQAPVYVEQIPQAAPSAQPAPPAAYWYYCNDSRAYYPYVKECPSPWQRVAPQPGG